MSKDDIAYCWMLSRCDFRCPINMSINILDQNCRIDVFSRNKEVYWLDIVVATIVRVVLIVPLLPLPGF